MRPMARGVALTAVMVPLLVTGAAPSGPEVAPGSAVVLVAPGSAVPAVPAPVLPAVAAAAPTPSEQGLRTALRAVLGAPGLGGSVGVEVWDVLGGRSLYAASSDVPAVPASTAKILTGVALLSLRDGSETLPTRAVRATDGSLVLVGGGDVLLGAGRGAPDAVNGRAGLDDLAATTASALRAAGVTTVTLRLDDTLFTGPAASPRWGAGDVTGGFVAAVGALAVDAGNAAPGRRPHSGLPFRRVADPALSAATTFAQRLTAHGVTVTGRPTRVAAPVTGDVLAEVRSAPLADLVEFALAESDNTVAEALARLVAVSTNHRSDFAGAGAAVLERLALLGVRGEGETMAGGSGLGAGYALTPRSLVQALALAAAADQPQLRPVLTGLPVAGASGTLAERFGAPAAAAARGAVRAKTGTLTGASSLAGTVVDADGRLLVFAVLADKVTDTVAARTALDAVAAVLADCGCR